MGERIRWEPDGNGGFEGYAGTYGRHLFDVWRSPNDTGEVIVGEWVLASQMPRPVGSRTPHGNDLSLIQAEAERWLAEFVSALGAVFPEDAREEQREHYRKMFALQQLARDMGRGIISCGHGWRGSFYGAVVATCPEGSLIARADSWRCHHQHPDDLTAMECALGEVRRLAAGGAYAPCDAGPDCTDDECRRDWAKLREKEARSTNG